MSVNFRQFQNNSCMYDNTPNKFQHCSVLEQLESTSELHNTCEWVNLDFAAEANAADTHSVTASR